MAFKLPATTLPFIWGAIAGGVLAVWVGFDALGWKTRSAAETQASRQIEVAVVAALAGICQQRFSQASGFPCSASVRIRMILKLEQELRFLAGSITVSASMCIGRC